MYQYSISWGVKNAEIYWGLSRHINLGIIRAIEWGTDESSIS